ncbi:MAG: hypothetical protein QNJ55_06730 [Xenococcus sp. MO_188.B8]|nr:hypothetical protein [Xenococcus sp. MO_188.B8]
MPNELISMVPFSSQKYPLCRTTKILLFLSLLFFILGFFYITNRYLLGEIESLNFLSNFNLNDEFNAPAFFSSFILFYSAVLLGKITFLKRRDRYYYEWAGLSFTFFYLAVDEAFSIHEGMKYARKILVLDKDNALYNDAWVFIGIAFLTVFLLVYLRFLKSLNKRVQSLFLLSAGIYILGALGLEIIGGYWEFFQGKDFIHAFLVTIEELLEMFGIILFINTLLGIIEET